MPVGERWCIVDPVASNTMRISGLKQGEQPEKVAISTQTCHSYVCQECGRVCLSSAGLTSHRRSHAERPLTNYEALTPKVRVLVLFRRKTKNKHF